MNKKMMEKEDDDVENVGIMQGFMDSMSEDDDDEGDDEGDSPEAMLERRPNTPEILMNNLRGDMRSIDARRDELADLVGYQAATETPETVLAMLQPILAQQGGIAALPQSQPMAQGPQAPMMGGAPGMPPPGMPPVPADMGMPPPGMPPLPPDAGMPPPPQQGGIAELMAGMGGGAPASDQPPVAMAKGGLVQNFSEGSDEEGVTPVAQQGPSEASMMFPREMVDAARQQAMGLFNQEPARGPSLEEATMARLPLLNRLLGPDRNAMQAQMLFDLGQRAFGFAANTDEAGRPLTGSFMSRLAGATRTLPASMGKHLDQINQIDRQIKSLALQQGEKDVDKVAAKNAELEKRKSTLLNEVLRAQAKVDAKKAGGTATEAPFGKSTSGRLLQILSENADAYEKGTLTPEAERNFVAAATEYTQTKKTMTKDDRGFDVVIEQGNKLPPFIANAFNARNPGSVPQSMIANQFGSGTPAGAPMPSAQPGGFTAPRPSAAPGILPAPGLSGDVDPSDPSELNSTRFSQLPTSNVSPSKPAGNVPPPMTIFGVANLVTGIGPGLQQLGSKIPGIGGDIAPQQQVARSFLNTSRMDLVQALQNSPQFAQMERVAIEKAVDIAPGVADSERAFQNRVVGIDNFLQDVARRERLLSKQAPSALERNKLEANANRIEAFRTLFGSPPKINSPEEFNKAPPGTYQILDPVTGRYRVADIR
jgi:hypothetical protein